MDDLDRIFNKLDSLSDKINALDTRLTAHMAQQSALGTPGRAAYCEAHSDRLGDIEDMIESLDGTLSSRIGLLEKSKIRAAGFISGVAAVGGLFGGVTLLALQYGVRKMMGM